MFVVRAHLFFLKRKGFFCVSQSRKDLIKNIKVQKIIFFIKI